LGNNKWTVHSWNKIYVGQEQDPDNWKVINVQLVQNLCRAGSGSIQSEYNKWTVGTNLFRQDPDPDNWKVINVQSWSCTDYGILEIQYILYSIVIYFGPCACINNKI
jgi:hypothetical protein